jgi:ComF family protein
VSVLAFIARWYLQDATRYHAFRQNRANLRGAVDPGERDNSRMRMRRLALSPWWFACRSARALEFAVMPRRCAFCGAPRRPEEPAICPGCERDLPWIAEQCTGCARPLAAKPGEGVECAACQDRPTPFHVAAAPLAYEFPVDAAIRRFKFHRRLHYATAFGELLCIAATELPADIDALLPVPLHWLRHGVRGFNQAAEICRPLQATSGLPVVGNVSRVRRTPYQSGLGARERRRNLAGAFAVRGTIRARHVLLIDDVITTGETCSQLARELLAHGAQKVSVLALAKA